MPTYKILRFFQNPDEPSIVVMRGLTLEQAQAHCQNQETSSSTGTSRLVRTITKEFGPWFDGYEAE